MDEEYQEENFGIKEEETLNENPWQVSSIYQFQYFCCPGCVFRVGNKQDFVDHTINLHPEAVEYLIKIEDDSLSDIICPWDNKNGIKNEEEMVIEMPEIELKGSPIIVSKIVKN